MTIEEFDKAVNAIYDKLIASLDVAYSEFNSSLEELDTEGLPNHLLIACATQANSRLMKAAKKWDGAQ